MKTKSAFTLIELLIIIAIVCIFVAILTPFLRKKNPVPKSPSSDQNNYLKVNDVVYIPSIMVTGIVNQVYYNSRLVDIVTDRATKIEAVDPALLKKIHQLEK